VEEKNSRTDRSSTGGGERGGVIGRKSNLNFFIVLEYARVILGGITKDENKARRNEVDHFLVTFVLERGTSPG